MQNNKRLSDTVISTLDALTRDGTKKLRKLDIRKNDKCTYAQCDLCMEKVPAFVTYQMKKSGWKHRLAMTLTILEKSNPKQDSWHSLLDEILPFVEAHWNQMWGDKKDCSSSWKKQVQDCLTHHKDVFQSGVQILGKRGYWRLISSKNNRETESDCEVASDLTPPHSPSESDKRISEAIVEELVYHPFQVQTSISPVAHKIELNTPNFHFSTLQTISQLTQLNNNSFAVTTSVNLHTTQPADKDPSWEAFLRRHAVNGPLFQSPQLESAPLSLLSLLNRK